MKITVKSISKSYKIFVRANWQLPKANGKSIRIAG